jgi:chaperone required for assembly of F1-ATPase
MEKQGRLMRRFWKEVACEPVAGGFAIRLDGRAVKTPKRAELILPNRRLADAVVIEWDAVGEQIDPIAMPFTGFANAAIDHVTADLGGFVAAIAAYGENDALCYRAEAGTALAERQAEVWDEWLSWAEKRFGVALVQIEGIIHQPQPADTIAAFRNAVAEHDAHQIAAMAKLAHLSGSLIATLAIAENAATAETMWGVCCLDELWQEELWGSDHWAEKNRNDRSSEFMAAAHYLDMVRPN